MLTSWVETGALNSEHVPLLRNPLFCLVTAFGWNQHELQKGVSQGGEGGGGFVAACPTQCLESRAAPPTTENSSRARFYAPLELLYLMLLSASRYFTFH